MVWFKWGFILNVVSLIYGILAIVQLCMLNQVLANILAKVVNVGAVLLTLFSFAWIICGAVFRWSHAGKVCSGDYVDDLSLELYGKPAPYQWKSGKFMKVYLIIIFCFMGLALCCLCGVFACAMALK